MKLRTRHLAFVLALLAGLLPCLQAKEPPWREPWQVKLTDWMKSLEESDVAVSEKEFDWTLLDPKELHRNSQLLGNGSSLHSAVAALRIPPGNFLWKGVWQEDGEPHVALKPYGIEKGQMWIPASPTTADSLAWLYNWDRPWNPYHGDRAVAYRAALISMIDLIMIRENLHYYTSGEKDCRQPPFSLRACETGFSLTFNAFAFLQVRDALPKEAREAWAQGLRWFADYNATSPTSGPEDMQLSVAVGIYYTGLALNDGALEKKGEDLMNKLVGKYFSPAGYLRDAGVPDGSYNGISLHRLAEYWAISRSPKILDTLRQAYDLKYYLTLPEPDGSTVSPSHFNARCKDGFDNDQYQGREVLFLKEIPTASFFVRKAWQAVNAENLVNLLANVLPRDNPRFATPQAWESDHRWDGVLSLPYIIYHGDDEDEMDEIIRSNQETAVQKHDRYTKNFGNEFYVIRRPAYAAIFYTGPVVESDDGATNHRNVLEGEGGYLMGFGGGGLSAFWTPKSSSLILGRMTAFEGYDRKIKVKESGDKYLISGWRDWLTNQIVGETAEGKIFSSSRAGFTGSRLVENDSKLEIQGKFPRQLRRQGKVTDAKVTYNRTYTFDDQGIDCELQIHTDQPLLLKSLYESLPVMTGQRNLDRYAEAVTGPTQWRFLDANGKPLEESDGRVRGVKALELTRYDGDGSIVFEQPVTISMSSVEAKSAQFSSVMGRTFLIELPTDLRPGSPASLRYRIQAGAPPTIAKTSASKQ